MIRVVIPAHLQTLARAARELEVDAGDRPSLCSALDALERSYPVLRGAIRDQVTLRRRPFVRFFACRRDLSHDRPDDPLPPAVASGAEPLLIVGAMAGG